jgi:hypothetical protein
MKRLSDTSPDAQRVLTEAYRAMTPERRVQNIVQDYRLAKSLHEAGMLKRDPAASRAQIRDSWNCMNLGERLWNSIKKDVDMERDLENIDIVREVVAAFEKLKIAYALGGSWASSYYGESRSTRDADLVVEPFPGKEAELAGSFGPDYYVSLDALKRAVRDRSTCNIINSSAGFKVDIFVCKDRPFEQSLMRRRVQCALPAYSDRQFAFVSPEDIVLIKLEWYRLGGEVSDNQWSDILGVLRTQAGRLDERYLSQWAQELGVADLLGLAQKEAAP